MLLLKFFELQRDAALTHIIRSSKTFFPIHWSFVKMLHAHHRKAQCNCTGGITTMTHLCDPLRSRHTYVVKQRKMCWDPSMRFGGRSSSICSGFKAFGKDCASFSFASLYKGAHAGTDWKSCHCSWTKAACFRSSSCGALYSVLSNVIPYHGNHH